MALTRRQREVYDFVRGFWTRRAIRRASRRSARSFGLSSVATVHKHVQHLVEKGFLRKAWNRSRSVEPVEPPGSGLSRCRCSGPSRRVPPSRPSKTTRRSRCRAIWCRSGASFALRVRGDSMIEEQIRDGDYVVVEGRSEARDGETVVALLRGEDATLKSFFRKGRRFGSSPPTRACSPSRCRRARSRSAASCAVCCAATSTRGGLPGSGPRLSFKEVLIFEGLRRWSGSRARSSSAASLRYARPDLSEAENRKPSAGRRSSTATTTGSR